MDSGKVKAYVETEWNASVIPTLEEYIRVPNASPLFDAKWNENGLLDKAMQLIVDWVASRKVKGLTYEVKRVEGKTPLLFIEVPATGEVADTILLYGHMDKQPPFEGWVDGLGPYTPVIRDGKLYGRGGADDGYAVFSAITAIEAIQQQGLPTSRCVIMIEACEESGSKDLPFYIEALKPQIGNPSLIICLDSGAGDYERMWMTTTLRGIVTGDLVVSLLKEGVHSGMASGIAPDSFRIARNLLSRLENPETGEIIPSELKAEIPEGRLKQTEQTMAFLGDSVWQSIPFLDGVKPASSSNFELALNKSWRPQLAVTGAAGLPPMETAGNVLRPSTSLKLSLRIPPTMSPPFAQAFVKQLLEKDPPYGAVVKFNSDKAGSGWNAPALAPWLETAVEQASVTYFSQKPGYQGEGGSIPFMGMLGEMFPDAQFVITGVLGPNSNAHGPNEFLHIAFAKGITCCVASIIVDQYSNALATGGKKTKTA